jgi:hypothetical protein
MFRRVIALGLLGVLLATPVLAQEESPSRRPLIERHHLVPKIRMEHRLHLSQLRMKHRMALRQRLRVERQFLKVRNLQLRMRPKLRLRSGSAEI